MEESKKKEMIEKMEDIINRKDLSIDENISNLGGMLYAAVIKRILNDEWQEGYVEFLGNMRTELLNQWGDVDEDSCLVELSAAQISGPALDSDYNKTFDAVDLAGEILDVDTSKLNSPKYISKGRELADAFKRYPKKILAAALVGGILFCGQPGSPILMGPEPAEASSVLGAVFGILASQIGVGFTNGNFNITCDTENAGKNIAKYAANRAQRAIVDGIEGLPDKITASKYEGSKEIVNLITKMEENKVPFNADEKVTILKGIYMLNEFNGLMPEEFVICMLMINPGLSNQRLGDVCDFMVKNCQPNGEKISFGVMESSGALSVLKKTDAKFDKDEAMLTFLSSAVKVSDRLITNTESKNAIAMTKLLDTTLWAVKHYYNNNVINNMARNVLDKQLGRDIKTINVGNIVNDRTETETDTTL